MTIAAKPAKPCGTGRGARNSQVARLLLLFLGAFAAYGQTSAGRISTTGPFEPLQRYFDLGVGYGWTTVNQHRLELVVLDDMMRPSADFTRIQWHEDDVFTTLKAVLTQSAVRP